MEWLSEQWAALTWNQILIFVGLFVGSLAFSFGSIAVVMVKIPENYFSSSYQHDFLPNSSWAVRWGALAAKNLYGVFLILLFTVRFLAESVKESQGGFESALGLLSTGQWLSIPFIIAGIYIMWKASKKPITE